MPEDTRTILEGSVVATAWYDERHTVELCRAIVQVLGLTERRGIIQYFREQQILAYSRIYKAILPFVKPESIAGRGGSFWRRQHDTGELEVHEVGLDGCLIRFTGNPNVCDPIYSLAAPTMSLKRATASEFERRNHRSTSRMTLSPAGSLPSYRSVYSLDARRRRIAFR